jgi:hypothetical protein
LSRNSQTIISCSKRRQRTSNDERRSHLPFEIRQGQRVASKLKARPVKGAPNVVGTPVIVGTPACVVAHGVVLCVVERATDGLEGWVIVGGVSEPIPGADA